MTQTLPHKHGTSFRADFAATVSSEPLDISGLVITSQIRASEGSYRVPGVVVEVTDAAAGKFNVQAKDTTQWPVGQLEWDVRIAGADGTVAATETVLIDCVREVTR